jgi:acetyltransferase
LHRTELDGVRLDLRDESEVRRAWRDLTTNADWNGQTASVLVQRMARGGVELFVGGLRDEQFGPVLLAGAGGTLTEFVQDIGVGLAPMTPDDAAHVVDSTRVSRLLDGWRGAPPAERPALLEALAAISQVMADPEIHALDVNPLMALPSGVIVVDAKLILRRPAKPEGAA